MKPKKKRPKAWPAEIGLFSTEITFILVSRFPIVLPDTASLIGHKKTPITITMNAGKPVKWNPIPVSAGVSNRIPNTVATAQNITKSIIKDPIRVQIDANVVVFGM